jgi:hypothetical protein
MRSLGTLVLVWLAMLWVVFACGESALGPPDAPPEPPADTLSPEPPPSDTVAPEPPMCAHPPTCPEPTETLPPPIIIPPVEPDTVVSIWIWPDSIAVKDSIVVYPPRFAGGRTVQFCVFVNWSSGENGPTTNSQGIPVCDSVLAANPRWKP